MKWLYSFIFTWDLIAKLARYHLLHIIQGVNFDLRVLVIGLVADLSGFACGKGRWLHNKRACELQMEHLPAKGVACATWVSPPPFLATRTGCSCGSSLAFEQVSGSPRWLPAGRCLGGGPVQPPPGPPGLGHALSSSAFCSLQVGARLLLSYVIIPFWHLLSNFNEMTQANKLSLNFPSLCPLVLSFINWTANVVLISSFLQLNLKWPRQRVVYGREWLLLDTCIPSLTSLLFFFLPGGDEWTRHTVSRHPWPRQRRHRL